MKQPHHPLVECGRDRIPEDNQQRRVARRNDLHRFLHLPRKNGRSPAHELVFVGSERWQEMEARCAVRWLRVTARSGGHDAALARYPEADAPPQTEDIIVDAWSATLQPGLGKSCPLFVIQAQSREVAGKRPRSERSWRSGAPERSVGEYPSG